MEYSPVSRGWCLDDVEGLGVKLDTKTMSASVSTMTPKVIWDTTLTPFRLVETPKSKSYSMYSKWKCPLCDRREQ